MQAATTNRKNLAKHKAEKTISLKGPSLYEVEYLRELKKELEIFLRSRNFTTIQEVQVAFAGSNYTGLMQVKAS